MSTIQDKQSVTSRFSIGQETIQDKFKANKLRQISMKETLQSIVISIFETKIVMIIP